MARSDEGQAVGLPPAVCLTELICVMDGTSTEGRPSIPRPGVHSLFVATEGQGTLNVDGEPFAVARSKCLIVPPHRSLRIMSEGMSPLGLYRLDFWVERDEDGFFGRIIEATFEPFAPLNDWLQSLNWKREHGLVSDRLDAFQEHIRFQQTLYEILSRSKADARDSDARGVVERTIRHLNERFHEPVTVEQLARMANMSRRWYGALFKEITGQNPIDYLTELRIRRAKELLPLHPGSLYEVARLVGFQDEHYFSRRFKQTVGMSPRGYVRNRRYVGIAVTYPELLYSLGVTPVAVPKFAGGIPAYLEGPFKDLPRLEDERTPDYERIRWAKPDLILAPAWKDQRHYEELSRIAPTVLLPEREDWRDELRDMGDLLGRRKEAEKIIRKYEAKVAGARQKLRVMVGDETVMYTRLTREGIVVFGEHSSRGKMIHRELGLKPAHSIQNARPGMLMTPESLSAVDADHIFLHLDRQDAVVRKRYDRWLKSIWQNETNAAKKQVYLVDDKVWYNFSFSPLSTNCAIDDIVCRLEKRSRQV
ncbi:ABC transporter substrate-binding protein [Cohnella sp.]|uniref:ABC transporter substrate-binding protein n=1 Tax=Cohnella sp. TaxID=1883426 RepID=UPI00356689F9